jgi:hypothetical protein
MKINQLPLPIFGIIQEYIINYAARIWSLYPYTLLKQVKNWNCLLNSSKGFIEVRREYSYFLVGGCYAEAYIHFLTNRLPVDHKLYIEILELVKMIKYPQKQVHLFYFFPDLEISTMPDNLNVKCFHKDHLLNSDVVQDISSLWNVKYVSLRKTTYILSIEPLQNCVFVDLSDTYDVVDNSNLHYLSSVRSLILDCCYLISDVSCLANVYELSLLGCIGIKDVSMLGRVHRLNISWCDGVEDISALNQVRYLDISHTRSLKKGLEAACCRIKKITYCACSLHAVRSVKRLPGVTRVYDPCDDDASEDLCDFFITQKSL